MRCVLTCATIVCGLVLCLGGSAQAADPAFCRTYARAALNQVRGGLANPRCAAGMQGNRWSTAFPVHYEWCLGQSFEATGAERDARTAYLRSCR
jgi:hypothetical protein